MLYKRLIYETTHFEVAIPLKPHIDRCDGGHIVVASKGNYMSFHELPDYQVLEMMKLGKLCGAALISVLTKHGIPVGIVNYQINGNWSVRNAEKDPIHLHIYGRARNSKIQKYGQALILPDPREGFYDDFKTITDLEADEIASCFSKHKWS